MIIKLIIMFKAEHACMSFYCGPQENTDNSSHCLSYMKHLAFFLGGGLIPYIKTYCLLESRLNLLTLE